MQSQHPHYPPPPHHPQAHFYGAPELDLGVGKADPEERIPGEGFCCILDSVHSPGPETSRNTENVLLVGFEHGLNVYTVDKKRFERIGRLEGLRGSVLSAKILPFQPRGQDTAFNPLVAVIIHGPYMPPAATSRPETSHGEDGEFDASSSMLQALQAVDEDCYQTSVEIYSLRKGEHVATLFKSSKFDLKTSQFHSQPVVPPAGDLKVQAKGRFIIVSSGISGETYIFGDSGGTKGDLSFRYKCIGKVWTRTSSKSSRSMSVSSSESEAAAREASVSGPHRSRAAILSLSHRWLAFVPPPSSAQDTLLGTIETEGLGHKVPGVNTHTSPAEPPVTCNLDTPEAESLINRMTRDVTQGAVKASQWVGGQGVHLWNSYWNKTPEQSRQGSASSPPNNPIPESPPLQHSFPPTHAQDNIKSNVKNQPTLVSILDLEKLSQSQHMKPDVALRPLATFSLPYGCSLISFAPGGLTLMTASAKGDVQHVWDLMRMVHGETGKIGEQDAPPSGPSVREVARFTRMTVARIIDVVWTEPRGDRLAIVTERGTVHIYDLPSSAFQFPPQRRTLRRGANPGHLGKADNQPPEDSRPESAGTTISSTLGMFAGKTQPFLATIRGRRPSTGSAFPGFGGLAMTAGVGAKSGKAVAAGINRSVSAAAVGTVNTIRHLGENRLALPGSSGIVAPGCVRWLNGRSQGLIAVTGGGVLRIHSIHQSSNPNAGRRRPSVVGTRPTEFSLPKETQLQQPSETKTTPGSYWLPVPSRMTSRRPDADTHPLSYAEIETNAPYQPFHTDRRVNLFVYDDDGHLNDPHHLHDSDPWVFGEPIPAARISVGSPVHEGGEGGNQPQPGQMEHVVSMEGNEEQGQQIVVTTRRKRNKKGEGAALGEEAEIFEDECEVVDFAEDRV